MTDRPPLADLRTEGDVETNFLIPLLTSPAPYGVGIPKDYIAAKQNIRRYRIGKGKDLKVYFPDFLVAIAGIPLVAAEAKKRGQDVYEAFREARLYAGEINAAFENGISPVSLVVATNGDRLLAGHFDQSTPLIDATYEELVPYSEKLSTLYDLLNTNQLTKLFDAVASKIKPRKLFKPRRMLGGTSVQDEPIAYSTFGATISAELGSIFNPTTKEDRAKIVRRAYVTSRRRDRYVEPIDNVIRASTSLLEADAKLIQDTARPTEMIGRLASKKNLEHKILLLVGGAGSGKTTFIDYLQEVALPEDIKRSTSWLHINMNDAPTSRNEIYNWVRHEIIDGVKSAHPEIDFDSLDGLYKLYAVDINKFRKGRGQLISGTPAYNSELSTLLRDLQNDTHNTAVSFCRFCGGDNGKLVVIVFDNCDKRERDQQLLMFEVSQWVQKEFRALIVLPIREETYDNHRNEPPLDTAVKDLVFRIDPPPFVEVLTRRVQLALDELSASQPKTYRYELPNSMHVEYAASDQGHYLTAILNSIFVHDKHLRRLMLGLSGRNLRRAFELFIEFCNSGHIPESEIVKIKKGGRYAIPVHIALRVILRMSRRYYDGDKSYIRNIFNVHPDDKSQSYFVPLMILRWLKINYAKPSPLNMKGYFSITRLASEIGIYGLDEDAIVREVESLVNAHCVLTEDFRMTGLNKDTLIRIAPAGMVHLELVNEVTYWAAVAEDTYFSDEAAARRVLRHIAVQDKQYSIECSVFNAWEASNFLLAKWKEQERRCANVLENSSFNALADLGTPSASIELLARKSAVDRWLGADVRYASGGIYEREVKEVKEFGLFVDLEPGLTGLVHRSKMPTGSTTSASRGILARVKILDVDIMNRRIELELLSFPAQPPISSTQSASGDVGEKA